MTKSRLHPAWIVLGAVTVCLLAASGLRATFGVYIKPIEAETGWSRGALSIAAALSAPPGRSPAGSPTAGARGGS
jgi:hypothetical protein